LSIKVLHINTTNRGGAGIAALRLHTALINKGIKSAFISKGLTLNFNDFIIKDPTFHYKKPTIFNRLITKLFPSKKRKLIRTFSSVKTNIESEIVSLPVSLYKLHNHPLVEEADIINLHWIGDFVDYTSFFKKVSKPIVFTLHDMNPFKGIFHYNIDMHKNPNFKFWEKEMYNLKKESLKNVSNGAIVSPSQWLLDEALKVGMFSNFKIHTVIQNSIEIEQENVLPTKERSRVDFGLLEDENVILFVSNALEIERKGFKEAKQALENIKEPITLLTIGKGEIVVENPYVKVRSLGFINDTEKITAAYRAADVLLLPSLEDNLPNTMLEAFANGTPVISFKVGGMAEHIETRVNGMLVNEINSEALKQTIIEFFNIKDSFDSRQIRSYVDQNFSYQNQASKYITLYNQLLN